MKTASIRLPLPILKRLHRLAPAFGCTLQGLAAVCIGEGLDRREAEKQAAQILTKITPKGLKKHFGGKK